MPTPRKHSELIKLWAEDDTLHFEYRRSTSPHWESCGGIPAWLPDCEYRVAKVIISINGHKVPEPEERPLATGRDFWVPNLIRDDLNTHYIWNGGAFDRQVLAFGLVHLDEGSAVKHAKALLSCTAKGVAALVTVGQ